MTGFDGLAWSPLASLDGGWLEPAVLLVLVALCGAIAIVDWRLRIIPDACNVAVAALGLALAAASGTAAVLSAVVQGALAFALFWLVRAAYRRLRRVTGLGLGDVKFLGAAAIWVGLAGLAPLLLVACAAALAYVGLQWRRGVAVGGRTAVPFGPFLVFGFMSVVGAAVI